MKIYAISDIHGEFFKLEALMKRLYIQAEDMVVFLGDYIDRGDMSFEVIDYLIDFSFIHKNSIFLMGNHEEMFMDYLSGINEDIFLLNGGQKSITSYELHGYDIHKFSFYIERTMPREHITFFQNLKKYHETDDYIFVHAGIFPGTPLENTPNGVLLWDRSFPSIKYKGKVVVFGHTPNKHIMNEKYKICIDTGACFESMGDLTAVQLPDRNFTRQGWTLEDLDNDSNKDTVEEDGTGIQKKWKDLPDNRKGGWSI